MSEAGGTREGNARHEPLPVDLATPVYLTGGRRTSILMNRSRSAHSTPASLRSRLSDLRVRRNRYVTFTVELPPESVEPQVVIGRGALGREANISACLGSHRRNGDWGCHGACDSFRQELSAGRWGLEASSPRFHVFPAITRRSGTHVHRLGQCEIQSGRKIKQPSQRAEPRIPCVSDCVSEAKERPVPVATFPKWITWPAARGSLYDLAGG